MRCAGAADVTARRGAAATRRALRVALARLLTSWKLLGPPVTSCDAPHAVEWQVERKGFPAKGLLLRGSLWGHCGVTAGPAPPMRPPAHLLTSSIRISHNSPFATMRSRPWNSLSLTSQSPLRHPCAPGRGGMRYTDIDLATCNVCSISSSSAAMVPLCPASRRLRLNCSLGAQLQLRSVVMGFSAHSTQQRGTSETQRACMRVDRMSLGALS